MSTTYTQEDIANAVAEAVKPLQDRIRELESDSAKSELEARFATEKAELDDQIKDLQANLDSAVLEVQEAKNTHQSVLDYLTAEAAAKKAADEAAARRDARIEKVKEVASFPDEYVESNADRWAKLSDEEFDSLVSDWAAISSAAPKGDKKDDLPGDTAMHMGRDTAGAKKSAVSEMIALGGIGFDPNTL